MVSWSGCCMGPPPRVPLGRGWDRCLRLVVGSPLLLDWAEAGPYVPSALPWGEPQQDSPDGCLRAGLGLHLGAHGGHGALSTHTSPGSPQGQDKHVK